jgi:hypothetical protein
MPRRRRLSRAGWMKSTTGLAVMLDATKTRKLLEKHVCPHRARLLLLYCGPASGLATHSFSARKRRKLKNHRSIRPQCKPRGTLRRRGICVSRIIGSRGYVIVGLVADERVVLMLVWREGLQISIWISNRTDNKVYLNAVYACWRPRPTSRSRYTTVVYRTAIALSV